MKMRMHKQILAMAFIGLAGLSTPALAGDPQLDGATIKEMLTGNTVYYKGGAIQYFDPNGRTPYNDPRSGMSEGGWDIRGDQYCSEWGGSAWSCYDVTGNGRDRVKFIGERGDEYPGKVVKGKKL